MTKSRSRARYIALSILFEAEQKTLPILDVLRIRLACQEQELEQKRRTKEYAAETSKLFWDDIYPIDSYAQDIAKAVAEKQTEIDEILQTYSQGWGIERMPNVDRNILRIGVWELVYNDDVPDAVAINEAVYLAKKLSTAQSPHFVNGLLGRLQDIKPTLL